MDKMKNLIVESLKKEPIKGGIIIGASLFIGSVVIKKVADLFKPEKPMHSLNKEDKNNEKSNDFTKNERCSGRCDSEKSQGTRSTHQE